MTITKAETSTKAETFPRAEKTKAIRTPTIKLSALQFQASLHGTVADQMDPLVTVCDDGHPPARIRRADTCSSCGSTSGDRKKAQEVGDSLVVLPPERLEAIKAADATFKNVIDLAVVEADSTYLIPAGSCYCLAPRGVGGTNYSLIAAVVKRRPKLAFIGEFSMGGPPKLFRLEVDGDGVLILREIARPEAIRERPQITQEHVGQEVLTMATQLADALATPFDPARFVNRHAKEVTDLIATTPAVAAGTSSPTSSEDILAQLKASIDALKGTPAAGADQGAKPLTTRRRASKKAAAVAPAAA